MKKQAQCHQDIKLLKTKRCLLNSIAKEEKALGRLLNAQAKQLESVPSCSKTSQLTASTTQLVETVLMKEWLLLRKGGDLFVSTPLQQVGITQLLESIAKTEASLAYLIETEADKLQTALTLVERDETNRSIDPLLDMNQSVKKMLETIIKKEMLLEFELDDLLELLKQPVP